MQPIRFFTSSSIAGHAGYVQAGEAGEVLRCTPFLPSELSVVAYLAEALCASTTLLPHWDDSDWSL